MLSKVELFAKNENDARPTSPAREFSGDEIAFYITVSGLAHPSSGDIQATRHPSTWHDYCRSVIKSLIFKYSFTSNDIDLFSHLLNI
jgi:hypothetical protein